MSHEASAISARVRTHHLRPLKAEESDHRAAHDERPIYPGRSGDQGIGGPYGCSCQDGVGLVYVGDSDLDHKHGLTHYTPLDLSYEGNTGGFTDLVDEVHRYGAKIGIEVNHGVTTPTTRSTPQEGVWRSRSIRTSPTVSSAEGPHHHRSGHHGRVGGFVRRSSRPADARGF